MSTSYRNYLNNKARSQQRVVGNIDKTIVADYLTASDAQDRLDDLLLRELEVTRNHSHDKLMSKLNRTDQYIRENKETFSS